MMEKTIMQSNKEISDFYACPYCLSRLCFRGDCLRCAGCNKVYRLSDNILTFSNHDSEFYWGIDSRFFKELLDDLKIHGWHDALYSFLDRLPINQAKLVYNRTFGPRRPFLNLLIPFKKGAKILDLGAGLGDISLTLAKMGAAVTALDKVSDNLKYILEIARGENISDKIDFVHASNDLSHLPFASDVYDVVILNGVLEWVSKGKPGCPKVNQTDFLREVVRIIKPTGCVYIGIENRLNFKYFLGFAEGHINMRFGALLPRYITRLYLKLARGQAFKVYTYSLMGYRRLLEKVLLKEKKFYVTYPHYASTSYVLPVREKGAFDKISIRSPHWVGTRVGSYFSPSYGIVASKGRMESTILEKVLEIVKDRLGLGQIRLEKALFRVRSTGKAVLTVEKDRFAKWHIQVGLTPFACKAIRTHIDALKYFHKHLKEDDPLKASLSFSAENGELEGIVYNVEPFWSGVNTGDRITRRGDQDRLCEYALDTLCRLHSRLARRIILDKDTFTSLFGGPLGNLRSWFTCLEWTEYVSYFKDIERWMKDLLLGREFLLVPYHGDMVPSNCLFDDKNNNLRILDWDFFKPEGLPLVDWITFVMNAYRPTIKNNMGKEGLDTERFKFHGYPNLFIDSGYSAQISRYLERMNLDEKLFLPLFFMWWVKQLDDWRELCLFNPEWRRLRVFPIIEHWKKIFDKRGIIKIKK